jgi:hypothetical protein
LILANPAFAFIATLSGYGVGRACYCPSGRQCDNDAIAYGLDELKKATLFYFGLPFDVD